MNAPNGLYTHEVVRLWNVSPDTVANWLRRGWLASKPRGEPGSRILYTFAQLDALHHERLAPGYSTFPPAVELWQMLVATNEPVLVTVAAAMAMLYQAENTVTCNIHRGRLVAVKFERQWRIPVTAIRGFNDIAGTVDIPTARRIVGINRIMLLTLSSGSNPVIRRASIKPDRFVLLDKASFMDFLSGLVVNCTADEWWRLREEYAFDPLLSALAVRTKFGISQYEISRRLQPGQGNWQHLRTPGGDCRVPEHIVREWLASR